MSLRSGLLSRRPGPIGQRERRERELAAGLRASEERLRAVIESAGDAIVSASPDGVMTSFNPAAERSFGYSAAEAVGQPLTLLMPERLHEAHKAGLRRFVATGERRLIGMTVEVTGQRKDGSEFPVELSLGTYMADGAPCFTGILRDVSDRERAKQYFAAQHAVLETLAQARGSEGTLATLLQAVADGTGWEYGAIWTQDGGRGALRCRETWHAATLQASEFDAMTTGISFLPGVGIPGRVWESGRPTWIEDVQEDPNFPRLRAAAKNDLHAAIGLPLWSGTKLVGVIEFFSRETRLADGALLEMLVAVANHIGEFLYRLRTEEELREAEERFRGAFDDAPTGMMLFSVGEEGAGRLLEVNRELCSITGFTMDQLEGRSYHDLSHPQEVEADLRRMRQLLAGRVVSYRHEQRYVHADGHVVWVAVSASLVGGASGEAAGGIAQVEDITERRGAEEQLARLGAIVESADDAIIGMTLLGTVAAWNAGAERLYGYSAEEAIGQDMSMLVPDGQEDDMPNLLDRIARGETIDRFDTVCRRKDGTEVDVSLTMSPTPDRDGKIAGAAVIAGDISERKRAEEELAIAAGELERSNAELEQFGVIVAHDLSEPMRVVAGFAELVRARYAPLLDADGSRFLDAIGNGAARMQRLIDDLLAYARVGRQTAWGTVDCQSVLDEALAGLARQLEETGATVEVDTLPRVQGDVTQIGQLFQNLIGNALKFAGEARPEVHVSAEKEKDGWRFRVSDNGIGMERKNAERIFHPFQRLNPSDDIPGTGIGLSICRRIVGFHRGRIWVEGSPGEGSVFNFTIADEARGRSPSLAAPR